MDTLGNANGTSPKEIKLTLKRVRAELKSGLRLAWEENPRCHWCNRSTIWWCQDSGRIPDDAATRDHVLSRNQRKPGQKTDVVLACYRCNQRRNDEDIASIPIEERRAQSMAAQLAVERISDAIGKGDVMQEAPIDAAPLESIGSILSTPNIVREPEPLTCPLCGRNRLVDLKAFWQHVSGRHSPDDLRRQVTESTNDAFESALVNVVNSASHDEAVKIATAALMGEE